MARRVDKGRLAPFVPLLLTTLDSRAWKTLSHGARVLYIALKRRVPRGRNVAYLSHRNAAAEIGAPNFRDIGEWYRELEHYGFIELVKHGCLGVDGKGKSPHWRLTELGQTSKASAGGVLEPATNDFLRWNGVRFKRKCETRLRRFYSFLEKQNPVPYARDTLSPTPGTVVSPTPGTLEPEGVPHARDIGDGQGVPHARDITSLTTRVVRAGSSSAPTAAPAAAPRTNGRHRPRLHTDPNQRKDG